MRDKDQKKQDQKETSALILTQQEAPPVKVKKSTAARKPSAKASAGAGEAQVVSYRHADKRKNNPQVGLVNEETDPGQPKTTWRYDPHIDPALSFDPSRAHIETLIDDALASGDEAAMRAALEELKRRQSPYLNWSGKAERTSFAVDTVSLHVHERIDAMSILAAVRKRMNDAKAGKVSPAVQPGLFDAPFENLPRRDAIDFYKHERGWANRLVAGDSLLVMNSLLQKESMAGQVQMIYIDPPYGIKYGSNFQPFVGKRDVKDRKDEDLTQEPEMIKAFRDTWELGIHSYLTYLRDRLLLAKDLLSESGSVFVQISDENVHHVREICDEIFGSSNFVSLIAYRTSGSLGSDVVSGIYDMIVWYAKDFAKTKINQLFIAREPETYQFKILPGGYWQRVTADAPVLPQNSFTTENLVSSGYTASCIFDFEFQDRKFSPTSGKSWKTTKSGIETLIKCNRLIAAGSTVRYLLKFDDYPVMRLTNLWADMTGASDKVYAVQTSEAAIQRCLLMTTDPGDLVLDPTCGSGTTAFVAEKWGRRWITCDTSRVAVTLAKQRLMTASYDYYELRYPHEGLRGGFIWKTVPHVTLKSIANNPEIDEIYARMHPAIETALTALNKAIESPPLQEWEVPFEFPTDAEPGARKPFDAFHAARQAMQKQMDASIAAHADSETLYDQPAVAKNKLRISGPFTVEAVPFPSVLSLEEAEQPVDADVAIARSGESARQHNWRDELLKTGIRGKGGQMLKFAELETLPGTVCLHASGTLITGERVVVSFGPEHAALEQRQVEHALREAGELFPLPKMIVFCAFAFDPEAAKDIDCMKGITALKAQMNTDLLTEDLKKARSSNQSFWLMGQPDVELRKQKDGKYVIEVNGFDYFDTSKGELVSGGKSKIAMWSLDTDYDNRSLFPRQVFFPMAGKDEGWKKLKKNIRAELNEELLDQFHSTVSLPFEAGENRKVAVKIVDDRGIESLKVISLD
jgi:adenine-specific DNA-methyltransferase